MSVSNKYWEEYSQIWDNLKQMPLWFTRRTNGRRSPLVSRFLFHVTSGSGGFGHGWNDAFPFKARHLPQGFQCPDQMTKSSLISGFEPSPCILAFPVIENDMGAKRTERLLGRHFSPGLYDESVVFAFLVRQGAGACRHWGRRFAKLLCG